MQTEVMESMCAVENETQIPADAALLMSALDAGGNGTRDRRAGRRSHLRVRAYIRLFSDYPSASLWQIYTRDINSRSMGFLTTQRMPLGHGGVVEIPTSTGSQQFHCTLLRCREVAPGWYEGAIYFNREQPQFNRVR